ncbi:MAG: nuclear transport factor 2 family protein [Sphingomonadales bacterium]
MSDLERRVDELAAEVRHLRDRQAILDCINSYGRGLDRLDADLIRAAYHSDAVDQHGPFVGGRDAFVPFAIECEATFLVTHHGISSHNCEIDGDVAHAESYVHFFVLMPEGGTVGIGAGRYVDRLEKRDGAWALVVRRLLMDTTFEVPSSAWLGPDWDDPSGRRDRQDLSYQRPLAPPAARG